MLYTSEVPARVTSGEDDVGRTYGPSITLLTDGVYYWLICPLILSIPFSPLKELSQEI